MSTRTDLAQNSGQTSHTSDKNHLTVDDITVIDSGSLKRAVGAAALGNTMEWFDFGVYSYLAVIIGKVFFPDASSTAQLIASFGTFAAAFLVRPVGGMVFGPLGDRFGRQKVLAFTMIMMSAGTFCIGLIPDYSRIGIMAPVLLLVARLVQGFSTGGEYGGAATFIAEYSTDKRRGFTGSFLEFGTIGGYLLGASLVTGMTSALSSEAMMEWGWRIPFFLAAPLGIFGMYVRLKLEETPTFKQHMEQQQAIEESKPRLSLFQMLKKYRHQLLKCIGLVLVFNVSNYMMTSYMPSYLTGVLGVPELTGLLLVMAVMIMMMPLTLLWGHWADRFGRRPVIAFGSAGLVLLSVPCFMLIGSHSLAVIFAGLIVLGVLHTSFSGSMPSTLPALFVTDIRYSALAIGFNLSVSLFGGTTPLFTAWLVDATQNVMMPAYYMMTAGVIGLITVFTLRETARKPLSGSTPSVATLAEAHSIINKLQRKHSKSRKPLVAQTASDR